MMIATFRFRCLHRGIITGKVVRIQRLVRGFLGRRRFKKFKNAIFWAEQARYFMASIALHHSVGTTFDHTASHRHLGTPLTRSIGVTLVL
jgi:hypothetical protein